MTLTIMLAVHCKKSEPADLKPALVEYVRESYGQQVGCGASGRNTLWVYTCSRAAGWVMHQAVMLHKIVQPVAPQPALSLGYDLRFCCCCPTATFAPPAALPACRPPRTLRTTWRR